MEHSPACEAKLTELEEMTHTAPLLLLYGARDTEHDQAVVLQQVLQDRLRRTGERRRLTAGP